MVNSEDGKNLKDLYSSNKRGENAKRLINLIEKDINNGRVLYNRFLNYSNKIVRNYHDAEDVLSCFILNLINRGALNYIYEVNGSFDKELNRWLYRGVRNLSRRFLRNRKRLNVYSLFGGDDEDSAFIDKYCCEQEEAPDKIASKKETLSIILDKISDLEPEHRTLLTQRYFEGASYTRISETQNIPIGTVKSRLNKAKKKFLRLKGVAALAAN